MMKLVTLLALLSSAVAFSPAKIQYRTGKTTALSAWVDETQVGITPPVGFWDPLGFSKGKSDETMLYYRESELKHGRVAMAACLGWYITAGGTHPFYLDKSDDPLKAAAETPFTGWLQFIVGCGAIEWLGLQIKKGPGYQPGDLLGSAEWIEDEEDSAGWLSYQNKELNNGRLAMLAIAGIYTQDVLFGSYGDMIFNK